MTMNMLLEAAEDIPSISLMIQVSNSFMTLAHLSAQYKDEYSRECQPICDHASQHVWQHKSCAFDKFPLGSLLLIQTNRLPALGTSSKTFGVQA